MTATTTTLKSSLLISLAAATLAIGLSATSASAHSTLDSRCDQADSRTEHAICGSKTLRKLDVRLNRWYRQARLRASYFDQTQDLRDEQHAWLVKRDRCGSSRFCLWVRYNKRIKQLRRYATHV